MSTRYTAGTDPRGDGAQVRDRIVATAYDLFCHHGLRPIGVDRIIADAGVAKMSLYKHFRSKEDLVLAVLDRREELWTRGWLQRELHARGTTPQEQLVAIFDAYGDWFAHDGFEGCLFINSLLETHDAGARIGAAAVGKLGSVRALVRDLAEQAGARDPDRLARRWHLLMYGAVVAAAAGDPEAARDARAAGELLLREEGLAG